MVLMLEEQYSAVLQPYIEQLGQNHINKNTMKALTYYDDIKKRVVDAHDKAENSLNDITDKLKRKKYIICFNKFLYNL
jgi:hypothetical protein